MRFIIALAALLAVTRAPAQAEVSEIRFAQQFSMGYLQFDVMKHQDLLAKHVAALGLPPMGRLHAQGRTYQSRAGILEGFVLAGDL